jgi:hypothetical protein
VPPRRGENRRTENLGRCSDVSSSPVSNEKCRQKADSLFANAFKSPLQQNQNLVINFFRRRQMKIGAVHGKTHHSMIG